jgi:hypothetical protein
MSSSSQASAGNNNAQQEPYDTSMAVGEGEVGRQKVVVGASDGDHHHRLLHCRSVAWHDALPPQKVQDNLESEVADHMSRSIIK